MKIESASQISHEDSSTGASTNNNTSAVNGGSGQQGAHKANTPGSQINGVAPSAGQAEDPYRYQQQMSAQQGQQQQQYPYYSYPPVYNQQQQPQQQQQQQQQYQNQYPYYQSTAQATPASNQAQPTSAQANSVYPNYDSYSRMNYVQNYNPMYQGQMMGMGATAASTGATGAAGAVPAQPGTQSVTTASASGVGQVQPVGSRPRVTTTMWEDEKTLCYQVDANGVSVVRRADNNMINGTKLLNVAHMTRGRRDGILKSEKVRDVVKIGSMHLKGVWIPFERALAMAQREGIVDLLYPLFVRDIKQVIQQGSTTQPQTNPSTQQWGYQAPAPGPIMQQPQQPHQGQPQQTQQGQPAGGAPQTQQSVVKSSNSPYMTPTSLSNSSLTADGKASQAQAASQASAPQQGQQGYYGYPYYPYQYGYAGAPATGATGSTAAATTAGTPASGAATSAGGAQGYQYGQYGGAYGYMPQSYPAQPYDEQKDK